MKAAKCAVCGYVAYHESDIAYHNKCSTTAPVPLDRRHLFQLEMSPQELIEEHTGRRYQ